MKGCIGLAGDFQKKMQTVTVLGLPKPSQSMTEHIDSHKSNYNRQDRLCRRLESCDSPYQSQPCHMCLRIIYSRIFLGWYLMAQELTQRLPSILILELQQSLFRHESPHMLIVFLVSLLC